MEKRYEEIFNFLTVGVYPLGYDNSQRFYLKKYASKFTVKDGELFFGRKKVIKSKEEARAIFREFHSSTVGGHSGIVKTRMALNTRFYWRGMTTDVANWVLECEKCKKVGKRAVVSQTLHCKVSAVWELVGIDLTDPLPKTADGYQYILTATDYFSKWVEAFPLRTKSVDEVGQNMCSMIYRHGCPKRILSDQGQEFVDQLNDRMCSIMGIDRRVTAAYHPQTNSLDEKTNYTVKRALTKLVNEKQNNWDVYLDATLFSLRSKVQTTTKHSPFLLMYGREAAFPSEVPVDVPMASAFNPDHNYYFTGGEWLCYVLGDKKPSTETGNETTWKTSSVEYEADEDARDSYSSPEWSTDVKVASDT